jgi:hypothetical protein
MNYKQSKIMIEDIMNKLILIANKKYILWINFIDGFTLSIKLNITIGY